MGAMIGPNVGIATIASMVIKVVEDEADIGLVPKSTEETINKKYTTKNVRKILKKVKK